MFQNKYGFSGPTFDDFEDMASAQGSGSGTGENRFFTTQEHPSLQFQALYRNIMAMNKTLNGSLKANSRIQLPGSHKTLTISKALEAFKAAVKFADLLHKGELQSFVWK